MGAREYDFEPVPKKPPSSSSSESVDTSNEPNYNLRFNLCLGCVWICIGFIGWLCYEYWKGRGNTNDKVKSGRLPKSKKSTSKKTPSGTAG